MKQHEHRGVGWTDVDVVHSQVLPRVIAGLVREVAEVSKVLVGRSDELGHRLTPAEIWFMSAVPSRAGRGAATSR